MLAPGTHALGPAGGSLTVRTYREGIAQRVGHDLIIDVTSWSASLEVSADGVPTAATLDADPRSLRVREGRNGLKPLSDRDRATILENIDANVLHGLPISFRSSNVEVAPGRLVLAGELTLAGATRPARAELELSDAGRVSGTLPLTQSEWGITPYRGMLGALRVRDTVEIVVDATLPAG